MIKEERFLAQINRIGDGIGVNISSTMYRVKG